VSVHQAFNFNGDLGPLPAQRGELFRETREHHRGSTCADHDNGLLAERLADLLGQPAAHPGCKFHQSVPSASGSSRLHRGGRWVFSQ